MSWREFSYLINGLSHDTPLGQVVAIRAEDDPERLKEFTKDQKRIRNDYLRKRAKQLPQKTTDEAILNIEKAFLSMAKKDNEKT